MKPRRVLLILAILVIVGTVVWAHYDPDTLPVGAKADRIVVEKADRRMTLFRGSTPIAIYQVALGRSPEGRKLREGDRRTPEGSYTIDRRKEDSAFHRALHISYPNPADVAQAEARGVAPGGDIMIHGIRNGLGWLGALHRSFDWTAGCIAVTDAEIEEIWRAVPDGTPIEIRP